MNARVKSREGFSRCNNISIQFEARPFTPPPSLPPPSVRYPEQHPPSIYAPPCSGWRSSHSTARPLTIVSHPCIPTPTTCRGVARRSLRHLSPRPIDGRRAFFPRLGKKKKGKKRGEAKERGGSETGRESRGREGVRSGGRGERCREKERKRIPIHRGAVAAAVRRGRGGGGGGCRKRARGSALPPEPRCGPIAIRKEAFFMGAARSAGLCDKN